MLHTITCLDYYAMNRGIAVLVICIGVRANIHLGGQGLVLPEWPTQLVCHAAPPGRKNNNEITQCLFLTVVDYTR